MGTLVLSDVTKLLLLSSALAPKIAIYDGLLVPRDDSGYEDMMARQCKIMGWCRFVRGEAGMTLLESLVALVIVSLVVVTGLVGLATSSKATTISDEQSTAESLARSQMEWVKRAAYVPGTATYAAASIPAGSDYDSYSANIAVSPLNNPDDGIQKITVTIDRSGNEVLKLEGYKVNR